MRNSPRPRTLPRVSTTLDAGRILASSSNARNPQLASPPARRARMANPDSLVAAYCCNVAYSAVSARLPLFAQSSHAIVVAPIGVEG